MILYYKDEEAYIFFADVLNIKTFGFYYYPKTGVLFCYVGSPIITYKSEKYYPTDEERKLIMSYFITEKRKEKIYKILEYKVKTLCHNNKYVDFGNHTGFKFVTRTLDCETGEVEFLVQRNSSGISYLLIIDGKTSDSTMRRFNIDQDFSTFFMNPKDYYQRENKLKRILNL